MIDYDVVGKSTFVSKKTGKDCYLLHVTSDFSEVEKGVGRKCSNIFVPYKVYDNCHPGDQVNLFFNQGGYCEDFRVVE